MTDPSTQPVQSPAADLAADSDHGVQVSVIPWFDAEQSDPQARQFVFRYRITIANRGRLWAKLISRHWIIVDADARRHVVRGEGVVGRQPELHPGQSFEYTSFCPLSTRWGTMEGSFLLRREDDQLFEVDIPRFYLASPGPA